MRIEKQIDEGRKRLLLFFCGWSGTPALFRRLEAEEDQDVWIAYDYRTPDFPAEVGGYQEIDIVAWSLGVWVAEQVCSRWEGARIGKAIAINGTPTPVHDTEGIPAGIFRGTLENLTQDGVRRFVRRMCGSREAVQAWQSAPARPLAEITEELHALYRAIRSHEPETGFTWTAAYISMSDRIFPPDNQSAAWQRRGVPTVQGNTAHYPFYLWKRWKAWKGE